MRTPLLVLVMLRWPMRWRRALQMCRARFAGAAFKYLAGAASSVAGRAAGPTPGNTCRCSCTSSRCWPRGCCRACRSAASFSSVRTGRSAGWRRLAVAMASSASCSWTPRRVHRDAATGDLRPTRGGSLRRLAAMVMLSGIFRLCTPAACLDRPSSSRLSAPAVGRRSFQEIAYLAICRGTCPGAGPGLDLDLALMGPVAVRPAG